MKILSIIAQKKNCTGSGVYLTELVNCFKKLSYEQEIICATYKNDLDKQNIEKNDNIKDKENSKNNICEPKYNYVIFDTKELPLKIVGMSDVMPYESMKYSEFVKDENKLKLWKNTFSEEIVEVINKFNPDLIICHHLYLLTAIVVDICKNKLKKENIILKAICHNTDLRQYKQTDLEREFIKENLQKLDKTFYPSKVHQEIAIKLFELEDKKTEIIGIGFNDKIFKNSMKHKDNAKLLYVGKVSIKKGVLSLVKAINLLNDENITLDIIGGAGDEKEYKIIYAESKKSKSKINFIEPKTQIELAEEYNNHNIFILPSFSEGIPIVPLEAMACGCKIVISDLPGVKDFYDANVKNAYIKYVKLPKLSNVDNATNEELTAFEERLAKNIKESTTDKNIYNPDLTNLSWDNIANKILEEI